MVDDLQVRVVSDGTPSGTRVTLSDGTRLPGVIGVSWDLDVADATATATVRFRHVEVDVIGDLIAVPGAGSRGG